MKKFISLLLSLLMAVVMVGCEPAVTPAVESPTEMSKTIKAGLICLHDKNSTYDKNFIDAFEKACEEAGIEYLIKTNIPENNECYEAALDLVDSGCTFIFADSFSHEDYLIRAASEHPEVEFAHATGTKAHTEGLKNFHNAFAHIYEGRYLGGVAAGMKLKEMLDKGITDSTLVGYVGALTYAEVVSGYTAFFLGVRSVVPEATMKVTFTGSWYDETLEKEAANSLIDAGVVIMSQHADSMGVPSACELENIPDVSYNGSLLSACPNTFIISTYIDWSVYFTYCFNCIKDNTAIPADYCGSISDGMVKMTELNTNIAAEGTAEKLSELTSKFIAKELNVFDTTNFTVNGEHLTAYEADVDFDPSYTPDTNVIENGIFKESLFRSAPYFDLRIDGIEFLAD